MNPNPTSPRRSGTETPRRAFARRMGRAAPAHPQYMRSLARRNAPGRMRLRTVVPHRAHEPMNAYERGMAVMVNVALWGTMGGYLFAHRDALVAVAQSLRAGLGGA